jgi:toxin ParE1/3/4
MTAQFRLTQPAITDIEEIADYIAHQSGLKKSEDFLSRLESKFSNIVAFPQIGRKRDKILLGMRSISMDSYLIFYVLLGEDIEILRVVSGYRDLDALFKDDND